jgi:hypothetical protein
MCFRGYLPRLRMPWRKAAHPAGLAVAVYKRLRTQRDAPTYKALERMLEALYASSLKTEEGGVALILIKPPPC